jgi:alpha-beta hydrolase superfamily lysophospholipase
VHRFRSPATVVATLLFLLILGLAFSWMVGSAMVRATPSAVPEPGPPGIGVTLRSPDGLRLAATYWRGSTAAGPAVLLLHGNGASRASVSGNAAWLAEQGYAAMTLDLRGHGQSDPAPKTFGFAESRDAAAALSWLRRRGHGKVAVIGVSLGGAAALIGEDGPLPADALILQAVYPDIRRAIRNRISGLVGSVPAIALEPLLSLQARPRIGVWPQRLAPISAIRRYPRPVLVIGGGDDRYTPPEETRALHAAAPGPKAIWIVPGLDHDPICRIESRAYRGRVARFLAATIGIP